MANFIETYFNTYQRLPSRNQIDLAVRSGRITSESAKETVERLTQVATRNDNAVQTAGGRFALSTANAALGGFGDEILDAFGAEGAAETVRASEDRLADDSTLGSIASQGLGFLAPGAALTRGVQGLSRAGAVGRTLLGGPVRQGIAVGATEGAIAGAGYADGETAGERIDDALFGASLGGVTGGILPAGGAALGNVLRRGNEVEGVAGALEDAASSLGITPRELRDRASAGESLFDIARSTGLSPEDARVLVQRIGRFSPASARAVGERAVRDTQRANSPLRENAIDLSNRIHSDSRRPTVTGVDPYTNRQELDRLNREFGEELGTYLRSNPVETDVVSRLVDDTGFSRGLIREANDLLKTESDFRLSNVLDEDEVLEILPASNGRPAGIYATSGESARLLDDQTVNLDILSRLGRSFRERASSKFDSSGNKDTTLADYEAAISRSISETLREADPEADRLYQQFVRNRSNVDLTDEISTSLSGKTAGDLTKSRNRIKTLVEKLKSEDTSPDQIRQIVRNALREGLDTTDVESTLKSIDGDTTRQFLRDVFNDADMDISPDDYIQSVRSSIVGERSLKELDDLMRIQDQEEFAKELSSILSKYSKDVTDNLSPGTVGQLQKLTEMSKTATEDLTELNKLAKLRHTDIEEVRSYANRTLDSAPFTIIVFGLTMKALAVAALRGAAARGGLARFLRARSVNASEEALSAIARSDTETLSSAAFENALRSIDGEDVRGWMPRAIEQVKRASARETIADKGEDQTSVESQTEDQTQVTVFEEDVVEDGFLGNSTNSQITDDSFFEQDVVTNDFLEN